MKILKNLMCFSTAAVVAGNSASKRTAPESATENGCRPSCQATHLNLPANKKIPDPFYRDNHAKLHRRRVQIHWTKY